MVTIIDCIRASVHFLPAKARSWPLPQAAPLQSMAASAAQVFGEQLNLSSLFLLFRAVAQHGGHQCCTRNRWGDTCAAHTAHVPRNRAGAPSRQPMLLDGAHALAWKILRRIYYRHVLNEQIACPHVLAAELGYP